MLVRHEMLEPVPRRRRRDQYRRWERSAAMELWQMDVTASLFLADGRDRKVITGIDDHSVLRHRYCRGAGHCPRGVPGVRDRDAEVAPGVT